MPQTIEAINHAKAAKVPMIVAINKIDKPDAKPERVRTELLQHEVQVESFGGEVVDVEVSAKNKTNLDKLLEMIALQAELLDLKTNPDRPAEGTVIEAKLDRGRGPVATVRYQRGTLRIGDIIVAGAEMGRVRALINLKDQGHHRRGGPVRAGGGARLHGPPEAATPPGGRERGPRPPGHGISRPPRSARSSRPLGRLRGSLEQMMSQLKTSGRKEFPRSSRPTCRLAGAIIGSLEKLGTDVGRRPHPARGRRRHLGIRRDAGGSFNAAIIGFSVRANKEAAALAKRDRHRDPLLQHHLRPRRRREEGDVGPAGADVARDHARQRAILEVFNISKVGKIAGCRVTDGTVERGAQCPPDPRQRRRARRQAVDAEAFKDEVKEVQSRPGMRHGVRELSGHAGR